MQSHITFQGIEERVDNFKPGIVFPAAAFDPRPNLQGRGFQLREINPAGFSVQEEATNMDPFSQVLLQCTK